MTQPPSATCRVHPSLHLPGRRRRPALAGQTGAGRAGRYPGAQPRPGKFIEGGAGSLCCVRVCCARAACQAQHNTHDTAAHTKHKHTATAHRHLRAQPSAGRTARTQHTHTHTHRPRQTASAHQHMHSTRTAYTEHPLGGRPGRGGLLPRLFLRATELAAVLVTRARGRAQDTVLAAVVLLSHLALGAIFYQCYYSTAGADEPRRNDGGRAQPCCRACHSLKPRCIRFHP